MPAGNAYHCGYLVPSSFWDLPINQSLRLTLPNLPYLFSNFYFEYAQYVIDIALLLMSMNYKAYMDMYTLYLNHLYLQLFRYIAIHMNISNYL